MKNKLSLSNAKRILETKHPDLRVKSGVDYDEYYVFNTEPKQHNTRQDGVWLNGLMAVHKENHNVIGFNPLCFDTDAYFKTVKENGINFNVVSENINQYRLVDKGAAYVERLLK